MPKLWSETIEAHRRDVRDAILETTLTLVAELGPLSVTMSQIADETGIGRATLYKYFPDVEAILFAWHERQITDHLHQLEAVMDRRGAPLERLEEVLQTYALLAHRGPGHHDSELARFLHRDQHVAHAEQQVHDLIRDLIDAGAAAGDVRADVSAHELATYCLHAVGAAGAMTSKAAVRRLVTVTLSGLVRRP